MPTLSNDERHQKPSSKITPPVSRPNAAEREHVEISAEVLLLVQQFQDDYPRSPRREIIRKPRP